jgi:hypothetical protein
MNGAGRVGQLAAPLIRLTVEGHLTGREQTVTALGVLGSLHPSDRTGAVDFVYIVQEHLTAIFDTVGVRSRGELVGQVFFRHCLPETLTE